MTLDKYFDMKEEFKLHNVIEPWARVQVTMARYNISEDHAIEFARNYYRMVERR